jgi:hypothetical protein
MMNTMILLKHLVDVLDHPVRVSFSITFCRTDMTGEEDIGGIN